MMTNLELRDALIAAFPPPLPITREMTRTADARWAGYEERDDLPLIEGKSWVELAPEVLERHAALLIHAGSALYRAILPAYLLVLVVTDTNCPIALSGVTSSARCATSWTSS
jgi:hypothetical protein